MDHLITHFTGHDKLELAMTCSPFDQSFSQEVNSQSARAFIQNVELQGAIQMQCFTDISIFYSIVPPQSLWSAFWSTMY